MTEKEFHLLRKMGYLAAVGVPDIDKFVRPSFGRRIGDVEEYNGKNYKVTSLINNDPVEYAVMERVNI